MLVPVTFALVIENLIPSCCIAVIVCIVCIGLSTTPQKHHAPFFLPSSPLNLQTVQAPPLFRQSFPYILFFLLSPPSKNWIFQLTPKLLKFFIINPIIFQK